MRRLWVDSESGHRLGELFVKSIVVSSGRFDLDRFISQLLVFYDMHFMPGDPSYCVCYVEKGYCEWREIGSEATVEDLHLEISSGEVLFFPFCSIDEDWLTTASGSRKRIYSFSPFFGNTESYPGVIVRLHNEELVFDAAVMGSGCGWYPLETGSTKCADRELKAFIESHMHSA